MVGVAEGRGSHVGFTHPLGLEKRRAEQRGDSQGAVNSFLDTLTKPVLRECSFFFFFFFFWYDNLHSSLLQGACPALNNAALKKNSSPLLHSFASCLKLLTCCSYI